MSEIKDNDQNTDEADTTSETAVEAGAKVPNEPAKIPNEPAKIDSIAAVLVEKGTSDPESNQEDSDEKIDTNREIIDTGPASIVQGIGHQLRAARMARCMSLEDVSRQLRISVQQIEAIEKEDFAKLPGRTFLRGFIRNYTNLMQLDPAPILKLLPQSQSTGVTSNSKYQTQDTSFTSRKAWSSHDYRLNKGHDYRKKKGIGFLLKAVLILLLLLVIFGIYQSVNWEQFSFFKKEAKTDIPLETGIEPGMGVMELELDLPLPPVIPLDNQDTDHPAQTIGITPLENYSAPPVESTPSSVPSTNSTGDDSGVLHFKFTNESWVEVRDSTDKIIFEQLNASDTEQMIGGKRPLSLIIGNAADVNLTYNGRSIDLAPYTDTNKGVARFTLE
jgi:cytoskeleton protein RodZ